MSKFTQEQVQKIREQLKAGSNQEALAARYGCSRSLISDIATNRVYKSPEIIDEEKQVVDLQSEITLLRDEKNELQRQLKAANKTHGLFRSLVSELDDRIVPLEPLPLTLPKSLDRIEETIVLHNSDGHADQVVRPEEVGGLENYNFKVACARAEKLVETAIQWTQNTLSSSFYFPRLVILAYGDHTSGTIHGAERRSYYQNQFKNCLAVGQLHALMIRDLAPWFEEVDVVYLSGNHGRLTPVKDYGGAHENFDYLIGEIAKLHCRDIKNVHFELPNTWTANVVIEGIGFNVSHGDDERGSLSIPFYGIMRKHKGIVALNGMQDTPRIRYCVRGHQHAMASLADVDGEILLNGAWLGCDSFSYNKFAGYREPMQLLMGVNPKYGVSWRLPIKMKFKDDVKGPKRYKVEI